MIEKNLVIPIAAAVQPNPQDIAYAVTHDLRAPLINLRGFSGALGNGIADVVTLIDRHVDELPQGFTEQLLLLTHNDLTPCLKYLIDSVQQLEEQVDHIASKFALENELASLAKK